MNKHLLGRAGVCLGVAGALATLMPAVQAQNYHGRWRHGRFFHQNFTSGRRILRWSGNVDNRTTIYIHGDNVRSSTFNGKPDRFVNVQDQMALPRAPGRVSLRDWSGRGGVHVIEQPRAWNNYTAAVRINDPQAGRSHYSFTLAWHPLY